VNRDHLELLDHKVLQVHKECKDPLELLVLQGQQVQRGLLESLVQRDLLELLEPQVLLESLDHLVNQ
jgi:hypothetical protein